MGRHGLVDDVEDVLDYGRWRGAVASAIRGRHGQEFLRELLRALDDLSEPRLICEALENSHGEVCALGALGRARRLDLSNIDVEDYELIAKELAINQKLAQEVMWINDENGPAGNSVPEMEHRFRLVREWVLSQIRSRGQLVPTVPTVETGVKHGS